MKKFLKKSKNNSDSKEATYTFNPCKLNSLDKSGNFSANLSGKSANLSGNLSNFSGKSYKIEENSIDLRDDYLTKKQLEKISIGENYFLMNNFTEKDQILSGNFLDENLLYSLNHEFSENKAGISKNSNISQNDPLTSMYSEVNFEESEENNGKNEFFEENQEGFGKKKKGYALKKTMI